MDFYTAVLKRASATYGVGHNDRILVVCGGQVDRDTLLAAGFTNVVISNLDERLVGNEFAPYAWSFQDAEHLTVQADSFDWVIVHAGLHHCAVPQQALVQMLRAGRRGSLVLESRDNLLMRMALRLGLTAEYEVEAVVDNGGSHGGVSNTGVPNFVYRWTEREVRKTVASALPGYDHRTTFFYNWAAPVDRFSMALNPVKRALSPLLRLGCAIGRIALPRQGNRFGVLIEKQVGIKPWLCEDDGALVLDEAWVAQRFRAPVESA